MSLPRIRRPRSVQSLLAFLVAVGPRVLAAQSTPAAFVGVNVIPMDHQRVLENQTVVVRDGRIVALGRHDTTTVPDGALVIAGAGRYLLPSLADMHAHPWRRDDLDLFLANGVTTVRVMWGASRHLRWRDSIAAGQLLGPALFVAGPIIEGTPPPQFAHVIEVRGRAMVDTPDQGRREVARQRWLGFDFIKVYNNVPGDAYAALTDEARKRGMMVAGHVPFDVGLSGALHAGQRSIEHLRGYVWELVLSHAPQRPGPDLRSRTLAWRYADTTLMPALAAATRDAGVWNVPTLGIRLYALPQEAIERFLERPEAAFLTAVNRASFADRARITWLRNFTADDFLLAAQGIQAQEALVRALHAAGAKLMAGTDMGPHGFSLHRELALLVGAGLSPFEALVTATRNPAEFLGWRDAGTIALGQRADLVLLSGNPLEDIARTMAIEGVMRHGRWLPRGELNAMLERARPDRPAGRN